MFFFTLSFCSICEAAIAGLGRLLERVLDLGID